MTRLFTLFSALLLAAPALSQAPAPSPSPAPATVRVTLATAQGPIVLELEKERAPVTTANFLRYVDQKKLDGAAFYRVAKAPNDPQYGLVQFGTRGEPKRTLPPIAHEPTTKTRLTHTSGTISLARNAPGTGAGDFFITVGDTPSLDADPAAPGDNQGFAAFGHVIEGMDVVKRVLAEPTDPNKGEGVMKGQYLAAPVVITAARRGN
ncbi:peptidylprolyl isomerase [Sphingomonas sp. MAH-20]|uniref:peptidylprolyl isomerase n=1 Tax=Sphingomonas horti TaxID=2682842 RepID=A0A6I4IZX4_9SPHN|nr:MULTISPECIES: peptidylprolyl isomerase [Sphingomonas]MBA2919948.1 peptidylprolyl isomerase [Sphingomonas sp. CGMCC 1.13658]MVO77830.1 peptidylprolyl isomerase [Sphingomonas horti]